MRFKKIYILLLAAFLLSNVRVIAAEEQDEISIQSIQEQRELPIRIASATLMPFPREVFGGEVDVRPPLSLFWEEEDEAYRRYPSHAIYRIWKNRHVNPFGVPIRDLPDTVRIDLTGFVHPVATEGVVTSHYGPRRGRFHHGIDLRVRTGENIYAAFDGKVRVVAFDRHGFGHYIIIRHHNGLETLYAHLSRTRVRVNQEVKAGDLIGLGGSTGRSTGPHLHFEFRYLGHAINPTRLVNFETQTTHADYYVMVRDQTFAQLIEHQRARFHVVRSGDTLSGIARRYGTTVNRLAQLNNIRPNSILRINQRIRVR